jgi:alkanesulfonate monooxygenase SsuD/methylene tetrahydromethanopterin reductase-like flavin-dependent oxidoreductase (luciferase family)
VRDAARVAIDAGFSGIWTFDHLDGRVYDAKFVLECWTVLSALAVAAPGGTLGPLVLNVANRDPGLLATMAATLQEVSGGRLLLGLGAGGGGRRYVREQAAISRTVDPDPQRRSQVENCIRAVRRLWQSPGFLAPDPEPPFVIGASGRKMAELAGRLADGLNLRATHPRLGELAELARETHARSARAPKHFLVTVHAAFDEGWLAAESPVRAGLVEVGVDRLILSVTPPYDRHRIAEAGRSLGGLA